MSTNPTVLLTGVTGFLGAHVLDQLLQDNYSVLCVVRSLEKAEFYKTKYASTPYSTSLTFAEVTDLTSTQAMSKLATGIDYIINVAAVMVPHSQSWSLEETVTKPTVGMLNALFTAAEQSKTVKRIVHTSSMVAVGDFVARAFYGKAPASGRLTEDDLSPLTAEVVDGYEGFMRAATAYVWGKTVAEQWITEALNQRKRGFEVVVLCPPMHSGPSIHEVTSENVGGGAMTTITSGIIDKSDTVSPASDLVIDVRTSAECHVAALKANLPSLTGSRIPYHRYLIADGTITNRQLIQAVAAAFPELKKRLPKELPEENPPTAAYITDKAERELGIKFRKSWDEKKEGLLALFRDWVAFQPKA